MKMLSAFVLAGALAFGATAALAQSNMDSKTSGNTTMTTPSAPNTGKTDANGDQLPAQGSAVTKMNATTGSAGKVENKNGPDPKR